METDRKFSQLHIKKAGKIIPTKRKRSQKTDDPDEKKQQIFLQTDGKMQKRMRDRTEKSAVASEKI